MSIFIHIELFYYFGINPLPITEWTHIYMLSEKKNILEEKRKRKEKSAILYREGSLYF